MNQGLTPIVRASPVEGDSKHRPWTIWAELEGHRVDLGAIPADSVQEIEGNLQALLDIVFLTGQKAAAVQDWHNRTREARESSDSAYRQYARDRLRTLDSAWGFADLDRLPPIPVTVYR